MVNLTRIYTRTGDAGKTRLTNNALASKTDARVEAYGNIDEANCAIGVLLAMNEKQAPGLTQDIRDALGLIQNEMFDVGADISNPVEANPRWEPLRIIQASIDRLENWCDLFGEDLPKLRSFILPGGSPAAAQFHVIRTQVRRAERACWRAAEQFGLEEIGQDSPNGGVNHLAIKYLNRLSDLMFILARKANVNEEVEEVLWIAGTDRSNPNQKHKLHPKKSQELS